MEDNYREVKKAEPCLKLIHMDQVEVEEIEWLFLSLHTIREGHHYSGRSWRGENHRGVADHCKANKRRSNIK